MYEEALQRGTLIGTPPPQEEEPEIGFYNAAGEGDLHRFDKKKKGDRRGNDRGRDHHNNHRHDNRPKDHRRSE